MGRISYRGQATIPAGVTLDRDGAAVWTFRWLHRAGMGGRGRASPQGGL